MTKPIRVLQVATVMNRGGLETMLMNYYRQIDRSQVQFDFMVHREEEGHYDDEIRRLGGKIYRMPQIKPGNYRKYFKLLNQFFNDHEEYKVVHSHINENSSFVLRAAKQANIPCRIAHSHLSDLSLDYKLPFRLYARTSMKSQPTNYFACSKKAGEWLFGKNKSKSDEVQVLNNAVNTAEFKFNDKKRKSIRKELGLREEQLVIGHIGRFTPQKNHEYLIDIFHEVHDIKPDSVLILAGEGPLRGKVERKVAELGLSPFVKFLGVRKDVPQLMQGFDLFLFPSLYEGLPVVLVEAQAAGLQCVVADTITKEAKITDRLLYESLDTAPFLWSEKILNLDIKHVDTSRELSSKGYDTASMADWLTDYYKEYYAAK